MRASRQCPNCNSKYSTLLIKVFVFKRRYCSKDKSKMVTDNEKKTHTCKKCGLVVKFDDNRKLAEMGVKILGASRDSKKAMRYRDLGIEVDKKMEPKNRVCQRCRNFRKMLDNRFKSKSKRVRELSNEEALKVFHNEIQAKMKRELREKQKKEAEEKRLAAVKEALKKKKKGDRIPREDLELAARALAKSKTVKVKPHVVKGQPSKAEKPPAMLTTPFNVEKKVDKKEKKKSK